MNAKHLAPLTIAAISLSSVCYAQGVNKSMPSSQTGKIQYAVVLSPVKGVTVTEPNGKDLLKKGIIDAAGSEAIAPALPYSVVVSNAGKRNVVGFAIRFDLFDSVVAAGGDASRNPSTQDGGIVSNINEVDRMPNKRGTWVQLRDYRTGEPKLTPGSSQVVTFDPAFTDAIATGHAALLPTDPSYPAHVAQLNSLANAAIIVASLDSVLFDDGEFSGPDAASSFAAMNQRAERDLEMAKQLHTLDGKPDADVVAMLGTFAAAAKSFPEPTVRGARVSRQPAYASTLRQILTTEGRPKYEAALNALPAQMATAGVVWRGKKK